MDSMDTIPVIIMSHPPLNSLYWCAAFSSSLLGTLQLGPRMHLHETEVSDLPVPMQADEGISNA